MLVSAFSGLEAMKRAYLQNEEAMRQIQSLALEDQVVDWVLAHAKVHETATTFKELIHEEFGDGIMSAIDFTMELKRESDPKGDRVRIAMSGKFLPYKTY